MCWLMFPSNNPSLDCPLWGTSCYPPFSKVNATSSRYSQADRNSMSAAQIVHCKRFQKGMGWAYTIAVTSTSLLFTIRVRAIYGGSKSITVFFGLLLLFVIGGCLTTIEGDSVREVGSTGYCVNHKFESYATSSVIAPLVNDTLVFLAISWRLMRSTPLCDGRKFRIRDVIFGRRMPPFSRALLKDGQIYYL